MHQMHGLTRAAGRGDANEGAGADKFSSAVQRCSVWGVRPSRGAAFIDRDARRLGPCARGIASGNKSVTSGSSTPPPCRFSRPAAGRAMKKFTAVGRKRGPAQMVASDGNDGDANNGAHEDEMERPLEEIARHGWACSTGWAGDDVRRRLRRTTKAKAMHGKYLEEGSLRAKPIRKMQRHRNRPL